MRGSSRAEKICTVCEETGEIGDSMKTSSSRMKNKVGAQKGAFIKMKQENMYIYQWLDGLCYVPIITTNHAISASVAARRADFFLFCGSDVSSMLCRSVSHPRHAMPHIVRCRWRNSNEPGVNRTDIINDARSGEFDDCPVM